MKRTVGVLWVALAACVLGAALSPVRAADHVTDRIKRTLEARLPHLKIDAVQPGPLPGLYEVFVGDELAYSDATGSYLFVGHVMDTRTRHDLSAQEIDAHLSIDFRKLPFDHAIRIVKGNGKRKLALFEDPDCPYCRQLEHSMQSISDVTLYVFLYPLDNVHPHASIDALAIWCSADRASAWTHWMLDRTPPPGKTCTGDPIAALHALGASLHIDSTPTMFLENGRRVGGAVSAAVLEKLLARAAKGSPSVAAAADSAHPSGG